MGGNPEGGVSRRSFLGAAGLMGAAAGAAACAPSSAPAPAAPPSSPAAPAKAAWETEWERLIAAAKQEGKLAVQTTPGDNYVRALRAFEAAFPGITVEHTGLVAANFAPRLLQERKGGVYAFDVMVSTFGPVGLSLRAEGVFGDTRSLMFRPDVLDNGAWRDGFENGFLDKAKKIAYATGLERTRWLWVNTDEVKDGEIKSIEDLVNPKWKGRIISGDLRVIGTGSNPAAAMRLGAGEDIIKRLWKDQEVVLIREPRQSVEFMVRGKYAIGIGAIYPLSALDEFKAQGLGNNLKPLDIENVDSLNYSENVILIDRAPHPNATKLFVNWLLTKEGQTVWSKLAQSNSRRADVEPTSPNLLPVPGKKYLTFTREETLQEDIKTRELAKKVLD